MRIIRHSHTSARVTEFVKEDRARVNIKVTPSLQYTDGIELRALIDDTTFAIVYLRLDDLRMIIDFMQHHGTVRQKELLAPPPAQPNPVQGSASPRSQIEALLGAAHELSDAKDSAKSPRKTLAGCCRKCRYRTFAAEELTAIFRGAEPSFRAR